MLESESVSQQPSSQGVTWVAIAYTIASSGVQQKLQCSGPIVKGLPSLVLRQTKDPDHHLLSDEHCGLELESSRRR